MNIRPIDYKQYDPRWKDFPYNGKGEINKTIKTSGCGPVVVADILATMIDKEITPLDTAKWSLDNGFKEANNGTSWNYFQHQFSEYGILCEQLLENRLYNDASNSVHDIVYTDINNGYYYIALMGTRDDGSRGRWTNCGHFVLIWEWNQFIHLNDPASNKMIRSNVSPYTFMSEVKNYWRVDARKFNILKKGI